MDNSRLRKILVNERGHLCEVCKGSKWLDELIPLEVHHVDGDRKNNSPANTQLICPNCHAQTHNYRGRNKRKQIKFTTELAVIEAINSSYSRRQAAIKLGLAPQGGTYDRLNNLINAGKATLLPKPPPLPRNPRCQTRSKFKMNDSPDDPRPRYVSASKVKWPEESVLLEMLKTTPLVKIAAILGVSDNAVRYHLKRRGIDSLQVSPWAQKHNPRKKSRLATNE